jgi:2-haloacid dehalogenase
MPRLTDTRALTFDLFGTVLDLGGSLTPFIADFLSGAGATVTAEEFWEHWRLRQRLEQFQDTIMQLGHSGYLETVRRAAAYTLKRHHLPATEDALRVLMGAWPHLQPFPEVIAALERLQKNYRLVVLSNGDPEFLQHLVSNQVCWPFDDIISATAAGAFKPHPAVYRRAARDLELEVGECLMVSANSFDVVGARACGFRAALVDRYQQPYEDSPYLPDLTVADFTQLANELA